MTARKKTSRPKARLGTYVPPEAAAIQKAVAAQELPDLVVDNEYGLEFGADSTGDAAVWIRFAIENDPSPPQDKLEDLVEFAHKVRRSVLALHVPYWPYVDFESPSR